MEAIQMFRCSFCKSEDAIFKSRPECNEHEKQCSKFISTYEGIINVSHDPYEQNRIGDMPLDDLCEMLEGCEVRIEVTKR